MAEPELFVICPNCSSEVSPYVTECPYCGNRLRKRAPDLKKQRKAEEKNQRKQARRSKRSATQMPAYLTAGRPPIAISTLIGISIVASIATNVHTFPFDTFLLNSLSSAPWQVFTRPFFHFGHAYAFVSLFAAAMFGSGIERRFGPIILTVVWLFCGAAGILVEQLVPGTLSFGTAGVSIGLLTTWLMYVVMREDLRDYDLLGLCAVSAMLIALPLATDEVSVLSIIGGLAAGGISGVSLAQFGRSSA